MIVVGFAIAALAAAETPAVGRPAAGRTIAQTYCGECHSVAKSGDSPAPGAPPLRTLQSRYPVEDLEESLAEGISVGHPAMPKVELNSQQIADFEAYLRSLSAPTPRRPGG